MKRNQFIFNKFVGIKLLLFTPLLIFSESTIAQNKIADSLQLHTWIYVHSTDFLITSESYSSKLTKETDGSYLQLEFLSGGELVCEMLSDNEERITCSNGYQNIEGSWRTQGQKFYIKLEYYEMINEAPAMVRKFEVIYVSPSNYYLRRLN